MERFSSVHVQDWKEITQSYGSTYSDLSIVELITKESCELVDSCVLRIVQSSVS